MDEVLRKKVLSDEELSTVTGGDYVEDRVVEDWHYCPQGHLANTDYDEGEEYCRDMEGGGFLYRMFYCNTCQSWYCIKK
ncbi:MAG: lactococcin family bacteriocin [Eubacterium sp.]|nr:lactococcin family bacteriocin [Eubacterium sp.]